MKSETKNWPHEIIDFLYKHYSETWTELNRFLYEKLKLLDDNTTHKDKIKELLIALDKEGYLKWKVIKLKDDGTWEKDHYEEEFKTLSHLTFKNHRVEAQLTIDGLDYAIKLEREREQHESIITTNNSVRGTNTKTWIIAALAAIFAALTFFKGCEEDRQYKSQLNKLKEQLQDSSRQIRETFKADVYRIEDSLEMISKLIKTSGRPSIKSTEPNDTIGRVSKK